MSESSYSNIVHNGFWGNNPALVQLLGLCPLLAVTSNAVNGLSLGLATALALTASNVSVSLIRGIVRPEVRIPVFVLVIAAIVTVIELAMNAYLHELYLVLGIFIPLIVTNCNLIGRAEAFASKNPPLPALVDGLSMGLGFALVLTVLGGLRELVGQGTLLSQAHMLFGDTARDWTLHIIQNYHGFLLAILPPGAFIGLGLIIAVKNIIDARLQRRAQRIAVAQPAPAAG